MSIVNDLDNCIDPKVDRETCENFSEVLNSCFNQAIRRNLTDYYRFGTEQHLSAKGLRIKRFVDAMRVTNPNQRVRLQKKCGLKNDFSNKTCWLTLSPAYEVPFGKLFIVVNKIVNLAGIKDTVHWCYEQRGKDKDTCGIGYHCHLVWLKLEQHKDIDWNAIEKKD